jgi:alkaline phosphatase
MTKYAIDRLKKGRTGYFLMVEAGRIDHAHHGTNAYRALVDTVALSDAVRVAVRKTKEADTLIVVTADHSHTLTISGYPMRGNPILGYAATYWGESLPNTTLGYANGIVHEPPADVAEPEDTLHPDYRQLAAWKSIPETHAGEDVAAYALGPNSDALHGVMEQNEIYNVLRDALLAR